MNKQSKIRFMAVIISLFLFIIKIHDVWACKQNGERCTSNSECCENNCDNNVCDRIWYNLPSKATVNINQNNEGRSFIYLEFEWTEEKCSPNFGFNKAVEFTINIAPKCFLQPIGGIDNNTSCDLVMGTGNYRLPGGSNNCYVDVWNYKLPPKDTIVDTIEYNCGNLDSSGEVCADIALKSGLFEEKGSGSFAVGVYDASKFKVGEKYFFRYPVEINKSPECNSLLKYHESVAEYCSSDVIHNDWGRAWITMQTFNNKCDLPWYCDSSNIPYECPHLIGVSGEMAGIHLSCINAQKHTDFWINRLCVPTADWKFTPGFGTQNTLEISNAQHECITERNSSDLNTHFTCCRDKDGDGYFKDRGDGYWRYTNGKLTFVQAPTYGTNSGDCNDNNPNVYPRAPEIPGDGIDQDCSGRDAGLSTASLHCSNGVQDGDETFTDCGGSCPPCESSAICSPGESAMCGNCGIMTCGSDGLWGTCQNEGRCTPNESQTRSCGTNGSQSSTCNANCQWESWTTCQEGCACSAGQCCDGCNFLPPTQLCNNGYQYRCEGSARGQDAQQRYLATYCSGTDAGCNGETVPSPWSLYEDCSSNQICQVTGDRASCITACTDTYVASPREACYTNTTMPGSPVLCLRVEQISGASWRYQLCKQGGVFTFAFDYTLEDDASGRRWPMLTGAAGSSCTDWQTIDMSYISAYGSGNGAGLILDVRSPAECTDVNCLGVTDYVTLYKECR